MLPTSGFNHGTEKDRAEKDLTAAAQKVFKDPKRIEKLTERVYELMQSDLRIAQERISGYSHRRAQV